MNKFIRNLSHCLSAEARGNSLYKYVHYLEVEKAITFEEFFKQINYDVEMDYRACAFALVWLLENDLAKVVSEKTIDNYTRMV